MSIKAYSSRTKEILHYELKANSTRNKNNDLFRFAVNIKNSNLRFQEVGVKTIRQ